jgi:hypothetical protein
VRGVLQMLKNYNNIDEFDKEWEDKLSKEQPKEEKDLNEEEIVEEEILTEDEVVDEPYEDEDNQEDNENDEDNTQEDKLTGDEELNQKPSQKEKEEYAFAEMTRKLREAEKAAKEKETSLKEWDEIARQLGYTNSEELLKAQREKSIKEEAKNKGIDPEIYRELIQLKEKVGEYEKKQKQILSQTKLEKFSNSLEEIAKTYTLSEGDKNSILLEMEKDGYNLEDLYEIKNPTKFIMGYAAEKITEKKVQEKLSKSNKEEFKEDKFTQPKNSKKSIEELQRELIKKEMEEYAKKNGLSY